MRLLEDTLRLPSLSLLVPDSSACCTPAFLTLLAPLVSASPVVCQVLFLQVVRRITPGRVVREPGVVTPRHGHAVLQVQIGQAEALGVGGQHVHGPGFVPGLGHVEDMGGRGDWGLGDASSVTSRHCQLIQQPAPFKYKIQC